MECVSAIKRNKAMMIHATPCSDLENIMLNEGSQTLKSQSILSHLYGILGTGKSVVDYWFSGVRVRKEWGVITNRVGVWGR